MHAWQIPAKPTTIITRVECVWQTGNSGRSFSLISLACMAMVDETLSCFVALQANLKPRVLHRNKRYVLLHKYRHNTCFQPCVCVVHP